MVPHDVMTMSFHCDITMDQWGQTDRLS